jgi:hypothetical protein
MPQLSGGSFLADCEDLLAYRHVIHISDGDPRFEVAQRRSISKGNPLGEIVGHTHLSVLGMTLPIVLIAAVQYPELMILVMAIAQPRLLSHGLGIRLPPFRNPCDGADSRGIGDMGGPA